MRNASRRRLSGGATYRAEGQLGGHQQRGVGAVAPGEMKGRGRGMWLRNGDTIEGYRVPVPFRSETQPGDFLPARPTPGGLGWSARLLT